MNIEQKETSTAYKRVFDRVSLYLLAVFVSPVLFGVCLALYSAVFVQDSWSFGPTVFVTALYSLPFFAIGAFPVSLFIDYSSKTKQQSRWIKGLLYTGFGGLAGLIGSIILHDIFPVLFMIAFGMLGGLLHFGIVELIKKIFN